MKQAPLPARVLLVLLPCVISPAISAEPETPAFIHEETESYTTYTMHGFTVRVSAAAMKHPDTTMPAVALLDEELAEVIRLTPEHTHQTLRQVVIWLEHNNPGFSCACYHPGAKWLADNGYNTDKEKGIEITNPANFVEWVKRDQPLMMLHELAHAYHHVALGHDHELILACYQQAKASKKYDRVEHVSGRHRPHYAMKNDREYFAELSEAYFGKNDFAPFTRDELEDFDPAGYAMIEKLWAEPTEKDPTEKE